MVRFAGYHGAFRIARRASVRAERIAKDRQSVEIQIVFADSLVSFASAPRAKHNVSLHVSQVVQTDRQSALNRNQIDDVHPRVDLRESLAGNHPAQQRLRRTAIARWIL